jgi:hypothetical protein
MPTLPRYVSTSKEKERDLLLQKQSVVVLYTLSTSL